MAIWKPDLRGRPGPLYRRICDGIADDIAIGRLAPGVRLPPQRELAYALGVSLNTVTRGYEEAVARGLLVGEVGRGTYVRETRDDASAVPVASLKRSRSGPIDFSRNLPAPGIAAALLAETLSELSGSKGLEGLLDFEADDGVAHESNCAALPDPHDEPVGRSQIRDMG